MPGFSQYLQRQQPVQRQPSHGSALLALFSAALQAQRAQQAPPPQPVVMAAPAPDPEFQRGYQAGLALLRQRGFGGG